LITDENIGGSAVIGIRDLDALRGFVSATLAQDAAETSPSPSPEYGSASVGGSGPVASAAPSEPTP
jgi:hypothetical protein